VLRCGVDAYNAIAVYMCYTTTLVCLMLLLCICVLRCSVGVCNAAAACVLCVLLCGVGVCNATAVYM